MSTPAAITSTTQKFLEIHDITNDLVLLKDGATALIMTVTAMNFGLLAEEEQDAIMYAYAGLLNSLNYPIQIIIRSQTKDATNYLNLLKEQEDKALNQEKRTMISRYRAFVTDLIKERNVLDKKFYVVIPASALEMGLIPPSSVVPGVKQTDISTVERSVILEKARNILEPKRDHLVGQFNRIGLFARQLNTQEIIQLFYTSYNPEAAEGQQLTDTSNYTTSLVAASIKGMNFNQTLGSVPPTPTPTPATETPPVATEPTAANTMPTTVSESPITPPDNLAAPQISYGSPLSNPVAPAVVPAPMPSTPPVASAEHVSMNLPPVTSPALSTSPPASGTVFSAPTPSITPVETPAMPPAATPATPLVSPVLPANDPAQQVQAEINATLGSLGAAPVITTSPSAPPQPANDSLPPLPEI